MKKIISIIALFGLSLSGFCQVPPPGFKDGGSNIEAWAQMPHLGGTYYGVTGNFGQRCDTIASGVTKYFVVGKFIASKITGLVDSVIAAPLNGGGIGEFFVAVNDYITGDSIQCVLYESNDGFNWTKSQAGSFASTGSPTLASLNDNALVNPKVGRYFMVGISVTGGGSVAVHVSYNMEKDATVQLR